jgi:hypothetical protein
MRNADEFLHYLACDRLWLLHAYAPSSCTVPARALRQVAVRRWCIATSIERGMCLCFFKITEFGRDRPTATGPYGAGRAS